MLKTYPLVQFELSSREPIENLEGFELKQPGLYIHTSFLDKIFVIINKFCLFFCKKKFKKTYKIFI